MTRRRLAMAFPGCVLATAAVCAVVAASLPSQDVAGDPIEVSFENDAAVLRGSVFLPAGRTAAPGVVILGGSERGPRTAMKHRLARHFAAAGVAALIYDSPGTGRSTGNALLQTRDARASEALAAVRRLREHRRVRSDQVGIMGISEGALITLLAAARDASVAFAIPVSGAFGVPMLEQGRFRIEVTGLARGVDPRDVQKALLLEEILFALFVGPERFEWRLIAMKAREWPDEPWDELIGVARTMRAASSNASREASWATLKRAASAWRSAPWFDLVVDPDRFDRLMSVTAAQFYVFLERGPLAAGDFDKVARELEEYPKVRCPVLAVWGAEDEYLPPNRSADFLERCLAGARHEDATFSIIEGASHILTTPGEGRFVEGYPELITRWLGERFDLADGR